MTQGYKPSLPKDKKYLNTIGDMINSVGNQEDIKFELLTNVLKFIGMDENPYDLVVLENTNIDQVNELNNKAFDIISNSELSQNSIDKLNQLWDYLAQSDPIEKADLIFVFGGMGLNRVRAAVKLYNEGYGPKIMFTGKKASYMGDMEISEAEMYRDEAIKMGIPEEDIIIETEAINTPENAVNSIKLLKETSPLPEKIILVSSKFHMLRCYFTFKAASLEWKPKLMRCSFDLDGFNRQDFYKKRDGWNYVFNEYIKIYYSRLLGHC